MDTGHPFDPTEPALSGYERTYISPYADYGYNRIPPPPPSPPKNRKKWALLFAAILLIGIFGGVATVVSPHLHTIQIALQDVAQGTPATLATPTSVVKPYTAQSVVNEIIARNLQVIGISYGQSIHSWFFSGPYADASSVPFQSSATWTTSGSCSGPCDGSPMGL